MTKKSSIKLIGEFEGVLIGLVTDLREYQLSWHLNHSLSIQLKRLNDVELNFPKKNKTSFFSLYRYEDAVQKTIFHLVSNKHLGEFLIPEVKQADYFLMLQGEFGEDEEKQWHEKLKAISVIQMVVPVDYYRLRSRQNLIFE